MLDLAFGLTETSRLGCQVVMSKELDGLVVKLPSMTRNLQASDFADKEKKALLSHGSVSSEIAELKRKLEGRRKVEQVDGAVQKAKDELVQCLRINDRRPLDCWKEREAFKREVGRLEREFVERTVR